ncbi:MAG: O-antigen ligase family protein [Acidimicrobiales bacterium]
MTTATRPERHHALDGQGDELGPIAAFGAQFFVFFALIYIFRVTGFTILPGLTPVALMVGTFGVALLAPRAVLQRAPVSLLVLLMIGWMLLSVTWTDSPEGTALTVQQVIPILVGFVVVTALISLRCLVAALLWTVRFTAVFTLGAVAALPEARSHIDADGVEPDLAGWHGLFPHKNIMTLFLVFGVLTILTFDRTRVIRWVTLAVIGALLIGSDSVTGLSSALLAVGIWVWVQLFRNLDVRNSSVFLISSLSVGAFAVLGLIASLSTITSASGRDLTFTGRTFIWAATWDALMERPLLGYGLGGIFVEDPITPKTAEAWRAIGFEVPHAHNGFLDLAIQLGFVGVAIFAGLFVVTAWEGVTMLRDRPKVGAWVVSTMVVQVYMALSENVFIGNGWLAVLIMFHLLALRKHGMELATGRDLAERLGRPLARRGLARQGSSRGGVTGRGLASRGGAR